MGASAKRVRTKERMGYHKAVLAKKTVPYVDWGDVFDNPASPVLRRVDGIHRVRRGKCEDCAGLKELTLGDGLTAIEPYAFEGSHDAIIFYRQLCGKPRLYIPRGEAATSRTTRNRLARITETGCRSLRYLV